MSSPSPYIVPLIASVKFVYILDFMMLMPLGPDVARALGFPAEHLGWLSAAYTLASMLAGLLSIRLLDRYDRKSAFLFFFGLLAVSTAATVFSSSMAQLLVARAITGLVGAPAVALGMAMVIDSHAPARRGAAIGKVMIGFSLAAVAGIPLVLELSRFGDWKTPFVFVAGAAVLVWLAGIRWLPSMRAHQQHELSVSPFSLLAQPVVRKACLIQAASQFSAFLIVPHFSAFFLLNLALPREYLGSLYLAGGIGALITVQLFGRITDSAGAAIPVALAAVLTIAGLAPWLGFAGLPLVIPFVMFMAGNAGRNVSIAAMTSQVPQAHERAGYVALEGMVQDISITLAALTASAVLGSNATGQLTNTVALASVAAALVVATWLALVRWQPALARGN